MKKVVLTFIIIFTGFGIIRSEWEEVYSTPIEYVGSTGQNLISDISIYDGQLYIVQRLNGFPFITKSIDGGTSWNEVYNQYKMNQEGNPQPIGFATATLYEGVYVLGYNRFNDKVYTYDLETNILDSVLAPNTRYITKFEGQLEGIIAAHDFDSIFYTDNGFASISKALNIKNHTLQSASAFGNTITYISLSNDSVFINKGTINDNELIWETQHIKQPIDRAFITQTSEGSAIIAGNGFANNGDDLHVIMEINLETFVADPNFIKIEEGLEFSGIEKIGEGIYIAHLNDGYFYLSFDNGLTWNNYSYPTDIEGIPLSFLYDQGTLFLGTSEGKIYAENISPVSVDENHSEFRNTRIIEKTEYYDYLGRRIKDWELPHNLRYFEINYYNNGEIITEQNITPD